MSLKVYHSLDFSTAKKRVEVNKVDPYCIHLEDYEDINDLIERSIRTKTKFVVPHVPGSVFDTEDDIKSQLMSTGEYDQSTLSEQEAEPSVIKGEVNEAKITDSGSADSDVVSTQ